MTVCVALKVQDCIVFAADSTTSITAVQADGNHVSINTYDHANKLFNLRKGLPIAAMTAGIGNFGPSSISTVSKDFRSLLNVEGGKYFVDPTSYTIQTVTQLAYDYFYAERFSSLPDKPNGTFQFWVGGYSHGSDLGELWQFGIQDGLPYGPLCVIEKDAPVGLQWGGQADAINRLVLGYSQHIGLALRAGGVDEAALTDTIAQIGRYTQAQIINPAMPITDAVDLARFLAETTKQFVRFSPGSNSVGGNIDLATITKHENFKWVARKHFYSRNLNPLETDHA